MGSAFYQWLVEVEDSLVRMIRGIFRYTETLPMLAYRFIFDTCGPVAIRACRVLSLAWMWLMMVFGPFVLACVCGFGGFWWFVSVAWGVMAISGSMWGLEAHCKKAKGGGRPSDGSMIDGEWIVGGQYRPNGPKECESGNCHEPR